MTKTQITEDEQEKVRPWLDKVELRVIAIILLTLAAFLIATS